MEVLEAYDLTKSRLAIGIGSAFTRVAVAARSFGLDQRSGTLHGLHLARDLATRRRSNCCHALREDLSRAIADFACLSAAVVSLVAVGFLLVSAGDAKGTIKLLEIGLSVARRLPRGRWFIRTSLCAVPAASSAPGSVPSASIRMNRSATATSRAWPSRSD